MGQNLDLHPNYYVADEGCGELGHSDLGAGELGGGDLGGRYGATCMNLYYKITGVSEQWLIVA